MTKQTSTLRNEALQHINAAIAVKFRDDGLSTSLNAAAALAQPQTSAGRTVFEYENLAPVGKVTCKANPGLLMRNGMRTGKVWFFRYRDDEGKECEHQLGRFPDMTVTAARSEAEQLRNLRAVRKSIVEEPTEETPIYTMENLCEQYIHEYAMGIKASGEQIKRSGYEDARLLRRHIIKHYGSYPAIDFNSDTLRPILSSLSETAPREAVKLRAVVSTMFNVACGRTNKIIYTKGTWLPSGHQNPANGATAPEHKATSFCPDRNQLKTFAQSLTGTTYGNALKLQLLSMTRVGEATQVAWAEFDLENAIWELPSARAKNKHGYRIQLSKQTVAMLKDIKADQKAKGIKTDFLFPAPMDNTKPINTANSMRQAANIRRAASLPNGFSTHALRHAGLTWLKEQLCPLEVRNAITNHRTKGQNEQVDGGYTGTANFDTHIKEWLQRWADHLDALIGKTLLRCLPAPEDPKKRPLSSRSSPNQTGIHHDLRHNAPCCSQMI
jgi:integrase